MPGLFPIAIGIGAGTRIETFKYPLPAAANVTLKRNDPVAGLNQLIKVFLGPSSVVAFLHAVKVHEFPSGVQFTL